MIPESHRNFVKNAIFQLEKDERILGLAAGGSWINGEMDAYSDLDLVFAIDPTFYAAVIQQMGSIAHSLGPCLSQFTGEHVGAKNLLICLYEDPLLHVDLKFVELDDLTQRIENPVVLWERNGALTRMIESTKPIPESKSLQWIEDRFWTWIHYGAKSIGRGEVFEALDTLAFLRAQVLGPLITTKAGKHPRGVRRVEQYCDSDDLEALRSTVASYHSLAIAQALKNAAKSYVGLREILAPDDLLRNRRAEMASLRYLHEVSEKL